VRRRPKVLFVTFDFASRPKRGVRLSVAWTGPQKVPRVTKPFLPVLTSILGSTDAANAIPAGTWRATLFAGRKVVATAKVRVG
jgi:hypothetical protein